MLELLRHVDPNMRHGAAETLLQFSKLLEGAPLALRKQLTSRTTLSLLILGLKVRTLSPLLPPTRQYDKASIILPLSSRLVSNGFVVWHQQSSFWRPSIAD